MRRALTSILLVLAMLALGACGGDDDTSGQNNLIPKEESGAPESAAKAPAKPGECKQIEAPAPRPDGGEEKPTSELDPAKTYEVEVSTNCGSFTIELDQKTSPTTAASFVALAKKGFFDGTIFHRIVPGFVIQGGDPTGAGTGGPGYSTVDKPPADAAYTKGVVAMAKTGEEAPGTSGSQFYVVTGEDAGLPPEYALLGKVTKGLDVTQKIGELGDPATEMPLQPVAIDTAKVSER
ncbi:MAG: peptidylprolyl isomerase [Thermoleophilaceae bacterium]